MNAWKLLGPDWPPACSLTSAFKYLHHIGVPPHVQEEEEKYANVCVLRAYVVVRTSGVGGRAASSPTDKGKVSLALPLCFGSGRGDKEF